MRKLYYCSVEIEFPVIAESEQEAQAVARRNVQDEIASAMPWDSDFSVRQARVGEKYLPGGYEPECLVYGGNDMDLKTAWELASLALKEARDAK